MAIVAALVLLPAAPRVAAGPAGSESVAPLATVIHLPTIGVSELRAERTVPVSEAPSDAALPGSVAVDGVARGTLQVVLSFRYSNESRLDGLLGSLSNPASSRSAPYLSPAEFREQFAPAPGPYAEAADFVASFPVTHLTTYSDRTLLTFDATPAVAQRIFDTSIGVYASDGHRFLAPSAPARLPAAIASGVLEVSGLGTSAGLSASVLTGGTVSHGRLSAAAALSPEVSGYPAPVALGSAQVLFGSDLQVAYDERSLFAAYGSPTTTTVALLGSAGTYVGPTNTTPCGNLTNGTDVGGWVPSDIGAYFNETLPTGEPAANVVGVPLGGATAPGCLASWDTSGEAAANTVALEMIGSTAPGAQIYGVYGPTLSSPSSLDTELAEVLNPNASLPTSVKDGLSNVTVVVTAAGFKDTNDSTWYTLLQSAEVRGITVIAATGDSSADPSDSGWVGSAAEFPASMAYSSFGTTAVGGTTLRLNASTLTLGNETAWNVTGGSQPAGSGGGVSTLIKEPGWQKSSVANATVKGKGRGVPDVAAVANNTAATVSIDGTRCAATNASGSGCFYNASGTGLAAAVVAGLVTEIDHALTAAGDHALGYADPTLAALGSLQYPGTLPCGTVHCYIPTGNYTAELPMLPFHDVESGRNFAYPAGPGYDLVTGWGSVDAYNLSMYVLAPTAFPTYGPLHAIDDYVNLTGVQDLSLNTSGNPIFSIQENLFVADSLGAPIAWVQAVISFTETRPGVWSEAFSGWVVYPFWGLYPNVSVYNSWSPTAAHSGGLPASLELTTYITPQTPSWDTVVTFGFGGLLTPFTLAVPGGAYILGGYGHTYSWQGTNYTDGPRVATPSIRGFLVSQIGLYAYPGTQVADFADGTLGTIHAYVEPLGSTAFEPAETQAVTLASTQTYEEAANLSYAQTTPNNWSFAYSAGATGQGISVGEPTWFGLQFTQTGVPASITWYVNVTNGPKLTGTGATISLSGTLQNGSYPWVAAVSSHNYSLVVASGTAVINGSGVVVHLVVYLKNNTVTFSASGNETFPFGWSVTITALNGTVVTTLSGTTAQFSTTLPYAKYNYRVASNNSSWAPKPSTGSFTIGATAAQVSAPFDLVTYKAKVTPQAGIGIFVRWTVTVDGVLKSGWATSPFTFPLPNGTYNFTVSGLPSGYHAIPSSGTFTVHGSPAPNVGVKIVPPPGIEGFFGLGVYSYGVVAAIAAAVLLAVVLLVRRRRRRGKEGGGSGYVSPDEI